MAGQNHHSPDENPFADQEDADLEILDAEPQATDITSIRHGAQALGKASWLAGLAGLVADPFAAYEKARRDDDRRAADAREEAQLAEWNRQMTTINGVHMTNEEAQAARQDVIDHADAYADQAIAQGKITEDQREDFKRAAQRKKDLQDKRGRGTITAAEEKEEQNLDASSVGQAVNEATADSHKRRGRDVSAEAALSRADANTLLRPAQSAGVSEGVFQDYQRITAPVPTGGPEQPSVQVKATGLDL